jgi:PKD repeat protein
MGPRRFVPARPARSPLRLAILGAVAALLLLPGMASSVRPTAPTSHAVLAPENATPISGTCPTKPALSINATPASGVAPLRVKLTANITGGCSPYQVQWQFGDEVEAEGPTVTHTFRGAGVFTIYAKVQDSANGTASNRTTIRVSGGTGGLAVNVTALPESGPAPLAVTAWANVTGGNVTGPGVVRWQFGDGGSGNGTPITHIFDEAGTYELQATATVNSQVVNGTSNITVTNASSGGPATNLSLLADPATGHAPAVVTIDAFTNGVGAPFNLSVCFGDGTPCSAGPQGWFGAEPAALVHQYNDSGVFAVSGTLENSSGVAIESATVLVNLTPGAPLVVSANESAASGTAPVLITFNAAITGGTAPYTIQWAFGDGSLGSTTPGLAVAHTYYHAGTFTPLLVVEDSAGHLLNLTLTAIQVAPVTTLAGLPSTVGGVPIGDWLAALAVSTVLVGVAITVPVGWRVRRKAREKEGEELVRELEQRR